MSGVAVVSANDFVTETVQATNGIIWPGPTDSCNV